MVERVQRVRHITADADNFLGLQGEFTAVTDTIGLRVHDGVTPGGYPVVMQNQPIVGTTFQALATVQVGTQLYFGTDTTTYINSPAADEIGVSIGGIQKVLISATAFVIDETLQVITTAAGSDGLSYQNLSNGVNARAEVLAVNDAGHDVRLGTASSGHTGPIFTNGPVGEQTYIGVNLVGPLTIGQIGGAFWGLFNSTGQFYVGGIGQTAGTGATIGSVFDGSTKVGIGCYDTDASAGTTTAEILVRAGVSVGSITTTLSGAFFNSLSDYRVKTIIGAEENAVNRLMAVAVYDGYYTKEGLTSRQALILAHEIQEIYPFIVHGEKDAVAENGEPVLQQADFSKLIPDMISAFQIIKTEVNHLKALAGI